jgi:hypothetical protein
LYPPIREEGRVIRVVRTASDGRFLLTETVSDATTSRELKVRDATTGRVVGHPIRLTDLLLSASVTPEGDRVLVMTFDPSGRADVFSVVLYLQWQLWDLAAGRALTPPARLPPARMFAPLPLVLSWDGRRFLTYQGTEVAVHEAASGEVVHVLKHHRYPVRNFAYSGEFVITESASIPERPEEKVESKVRLWNARTGEAVGPPRTDSGSTRGALARSARTGSTLSSFFGIPCGKTPAPIQGTAE